ncbi:hypothetical protein [uncultured Xylophilus sp.]|uniref:hypothetical protein n=1 Tax=uncultured Xylophilus sp. TaxID=296832 RepID=UPI0025ECA290|nr:hypothetical protein [uncultured Xylophilus sp.]
MFALIARLLSFVSGRSAGAPAGDLPRGLLESAEARAGRDPRDAQSLRTAAQAYLRVVR